MKFKTVSVALSFLFVVGVAAAGNLSINEFLEEGTCPKLGPIPACYIILICLIIPFVLHIFGKGKIIYFLFVSFALILASYASIGQLFLKIQCPKTGNGMPMCYISFIIFALLLGLKIVQLRKQGV